MFFYVSLFVACVISAFLVLYLYNALANAGKAVTKVLLPSAKDNVTGHLEKTRYYATKNSAPTPWGWKGNDKGVRDRGPRTAQVNSASGLDALLNNNGNSSASAGWPYREEKTEFAGKAYKVSRKAGFRLSGRKPGGKPWGW